MTTTTTTTERQKAAEVAQSYPGWTIWTTRNGSPVATRTGGQRAPAADDSGTWAATLIADDWTDLTTQLAVQAQFDAERTYDTAG
ncbi:MAG TPA: hypothetical protein VHT26_24280 [Trebonia sp.]|nr:hypothetical protein [Trebonia sp.]